MPDTQAHQQHSVRGGLYIDPLPFGEIEVAPLPAIAHIPVDAKSEISVSVGDTVLTGQPVTTCNDQIVANHASVSGRVISITQNTVSIQSDQLDTPYLCKVQSLHNKNDYQQLFRSMGLVGLGGAAFPVDKKLNSLEPTTLLINAAECDPAIYCDEALMQERSAKVIQGIEIAIVASGAKKCIIGIEDNKSKALEQMKAHLPDHMKLICVPAIYPSGAEKTLLRLCTGKTGALKENDTICFNVATCYAMYQAVSKSRPLISRIVTIVENARVRNLEVRIGTPVKELLTPLERSTSVVCGGRMMGRVVTQDHCVDKRTNSILLHTDNHPAATPCIRCGACEEVCPESLLPQHLYWHATTPDTAKLQELKLDQCIECGCCDAVCPSHIPLAGLFNSAKRTIEKEETEQHKAALAKYRYEKHLARQSEKTVRQRKQLDSKTEILKTTNADNEAKKALIAKALQRKKNKRAVETDKKSDRDSTL